MTLFVRFLACLTLIVIGGGAVVMGADGPAETLFCGLFLAGIAGIFLIAVGID